MVDAVATSQLLEEHVELAIAGRLYAGWKQVSVTRALDQLSGSFQLTLANKARTDGQAFPIVAGDACQLRIAGETVIDGWVEFVGPSIEGEAHDIAVQGRDRTCDLVDCSAIHKPGSWKAAKLEAIASELAQPFGISVSAKVSTGAAIKAFALQQGETVWAAIERLLRFRGLLMQTTATGDLEIVKPDVGAPVAVLELGRNIKSISSSFDGRDRFSKYVVKGQAAGDDDANGKTVSQIRSEASDAGVNRYRPLLIVAEEQGNGATLKARAAYEAGVRAGRAVCATIVVPGWRTAPGGSLWRQNVRVRVKAPAAQLPNSTMLVTAVTFTKDAGGTTAQLTVMPPEAWQQLAQPEGKAA